MGQAGHMEERSRLAAPSDATHSMGVNADLWQTCSRVLTECRRIRSFAAELRSVVASLEDAGTRHALEQHARSLEHAAALGDVAAASLTDRRSRHH